MRLPLIALTLAAVALLGAACDSTPLAPEKAPVETRTATPVSALTTGTPGTGAAGAAGATPQTQVATVDLARGATGAAATALLAATAQRVVYFDFDSYAIKDEFRPMIEGHARVLSGNRSLHMVVEGHTDERGGREYNLALGQKRAESVLHSLTLLGANEAQLEAVSFGKERPAVAGSDEAAWARNRRAELKDR